MWIIKKIQCTNVQTIKELEYTLEQGVTTLLFGHNCDNPTQKSNGSGKSAMLEVISLGILGNSARPVRIDEIINDDENKATTDIELYNEDTDTTMFIHREFFKKSGSTISLKMKVGNDDIPESDYAQPSLSEYKNFIFSQLGITESEFVNNFLLSKHKYTSFFDSTDREKKEIINNLSNAIIVDPAIEILLSDIETKEKTLRAIELEKSSNEGAISAIDEQIQFAKSEEYRASKDNKLKEAQENIVANSTKLNEQIEVVENLKSAGFAIDKNKNIIESIINKDLELSDYLSLAKKSDFNIDFPDASDLSLMMERLLIESIDKNEKDNQTLVEYSSSVTDINEDIKKSNDRNIVHQTELKTLKSKIDVIQEKYTQLTREQRAKMNNISSRLDEINNNLIEDRQKNVTFISKINRLNTIIKGAITCPKCQHKFLLDNEGASLDETLNDLQETYNLQEQLESKIKADSGYLERLSADKDDVYDDISKMDSKQEDEIADVEVEIKILNGKIKNENETNQELLDELQATEQDIAKISRRISNSKEDTLSAIQDELMRVVKKHRKNVENAEIELSFLQNKNSVLTNNLQKIKDTNVNDLILSFEKTRSGLLDDKINIDKNYQNAKMQLDKLVEQKGTFDEFKTFLVNSKIEALAYEINFFLEKLDTDIRINISGYKISKTGKLSEKIYTSIIRDGVDFGSLYKLSEGEKATVHLATILARQKLINMSADNSKGINFLFIDEVLDSIDANGLNKIFQILNDYAITSIIISHGNIIENYPYKITIKKTDGVSELIK